MNGAGPRPLFELRATAGGVRSWLARQLQAVIATLGAMARTPLATAMTVAVVAAALALPAALQMVLVNIDQAVSGWGTQARVSLYLRPSVEDDTARALARRLEALPDVDRAVLTTRADALAEYERMVGLEGVASLLGEDNPLPAVLDVIPRGEGADSARIKALGRILGQLREVEMVRVDLDWVRRLEGLLGLTERALWLLGGFLAVAVVLVVGNTLRLAVDGRREETGPRAGWPQRIKVSTH
jgi:cell division transport system permease protein